MNGAKLAILTGVENHAQQNQGSWVSWRGKLCLLLVCALLSGCASVDLWQRQKLYRPTAVTSAQAWQAMLAQRPELQVLSVPVGTAGEHVQVLRWPAVPGHTSAVRVLYLHGTFRHAFQNLAKAEPMHRAGFDVYLLDYRGWGASSPRVPNEASIHEDAWTAWQALQAEAASKPVRWVIYGHSMGSGVAVRLAERLSGTQAYCALVLESAFTSFPDVAQAAAGSLGGWLARLGGERMASIDRIAAVDPPLWFLHGSHDSTIPMALGRRLYDRAPAPKTWLDFPLRHSDLQTDNSGRYAAVWTGIERVCQGAQSP